MSSLSASSPSSTSSPHRFPTDTTLFLHDYLPPLFIVPTGSSSSFACSNFSYCSALIGAKVHHRRQCRNGVIPQVMQMIFKRVEETKGTTEFLIRVSFIEIFKEVVFDLLESNPSIYSKTDGNGKPAGPSRAPVQIRETANGGISLAGVTEAEVTSQEEMDSFLLK
ncbi:hypothetical protein L2E82_29108 [Cichorium intybus]|uniref:Uncharacterized protein n=1 Tax=Cichorium intybus TaxID=13427 RepID=A0ACB9CX26_CICIN|nr:hypothetical protein L2E82_29108 [Cichorium intybus]